MGSSGGAVGWVEDQYKRVEDAFNDAKNTKAGSLIGTAIGGPGMGVIGAATGAVTDVQANQVEKQARRAGEEQISTAQAEANAQMQAIEEARKEQETAKQNAINKRRAALANRTQTRFASASLLGRSDVNGKTLLGG